ncbi:MAG: helix-turn-helix domain-containing protein [Spirochaetaceae bacterium]|jgi:hypothetical protein|nr:helix-turn-helix domain-containing protein [Spirochaetaceae bacterium]
MQISSSIIFFLLERKFPLRYLREDQGGMAILEPRILESPDTEPEILYITDKPELLAAVQKPVSCAFLLCGEAGKSAVDFQSGERELPLCLKAADTACVTADISPVNLLETVFSLFLTLQDWDSRLKDASFEAVEDYTRLFGTIRELFDLPFILMDRNFTTIAYTPDFYTGLEETNRGKAPVEAVNQFFQKDEEGHDSSTELIEPYLYASANDGTRRWICCNIFRGSDFEGRIAAIPDQEKNHPGRFQLLAHFCRYVGMVFINTTDDMPARRQQDTLHRLVRDSIFTADGVPEQNAAGILGELAWQLDDPYFLAVFQISHERRFSHSALHICRHLETDVLYSCAVTYASHIIWLVNTRDVAKLNIKRDYRQLLSFIVRMYNCKAGVSNLFCNFMELRGAYTQSMAALRLGYRRDPGLSVYRFSDYTLDYILERSVSELPQEILLHPGALTLHNLDRNTGTDYIKTLRYYMDCRYNMTEAAQKLYVHRTTLIRRLDRITELTGLDFKEPRETLRMAISLHLLAPPDSGSA